jgi:hypothetical protein
MELCPDDETKRRQRGRSLPILLVAMLGLAFLVMGSTRMLGPSISPLERARHKSELTALRARHDAERAERAEKLMVTYDLMRRQARRRDMRTAKAYSKSVKLASGLERDRE